jgi:hypothetical protein
VPSALDVWLGEPRSRADSSHATGIQQRHRCAWPSGHGRGDYAVRALDPRGQRLTFPASLRGLRWVVEGGVARLHVGQLDALPFDDDAVVIEKRGGYPPWVRAGIGAVVSANGGWAAVVGSHFVECFGPYWCRLRRGACQRREGCDAAPTAHEREKWR